MPSPGWQTSGSMLPRPQSGERGLQSSALNEPGTDWVMTMMDALELELRQLPGVLFVSFSEDEGTMFIELVVSSGTEQAKVRDEAARCAINHLEGPSEIRVLNPPREQLMPVAGERVKLLLVLPSDGGASIEVQLARGAQRH